MFAYHSDSKLLVLQQSKPTDLNSNIHLIQTDNIKVPRLLLRTDLHKVNVDSGCLLCPSGKV